MAKVTQMLTIEKDCLLMTLEDKWGGSIVVLGQLELEKGKMKLTCCSNDGKHKWPLSDFLSEKIEVSPTGNLVK